MTVLDRYAYWLPRLSERDRDYARSQLAEVTEICAVDPDRPEWLALYYRLTVAGIESENPAEALRQALDAETGDPGEVCRALAAIERTSKEWAEWWPAWHPSSN